MRTKSLSVFLHTRLCFIDSVEKMNKLDMLYDLSNAQGISVMLNIEISTFDPTPLATTDRSPFSLCFITYLTRNQ